MKIAVIEWPLFWQVWRQQNSLELEHWLARWHFSDDAVRLSMHPARTEAPSQTRDREDEDPLAIKLIALRMIGEPVHGRSNDTGASGLRQSFQPVQASN